MRTAKEVRNYRVTMKMLCMVLAMLVSVSAILYLTASLYKKTGSFTVSIDKYEMTKYGLSLSESPEMLHKTSHLNAQINESITNIAKEEIPDNVDSIDGAHNGRNYIAYTFYAQNAGEVEVSYEYAVTMANITNGLDEAIRLRLYVNGESTDYAKAKSDGSGNEPGCEAFFSGTVMAKGRIDEFSPGEITKYTVVVWIEGTDSDCVDWLIGGQIKIDMEMNIVH